MSEIIKRLEEILTKTKNHDRLLRKELEGYVKELKAFNFTKEQIYILYEAVNNNIEDLAIKPKRIAPKSGKYQYKWDILQELKDLLNNQINWDKPSTNTEVKNER